MSIPDDIKDKLNLAISDIVALKGGYAGDIRQFTRQRKLTDTDIFRFLIGCSGGTLNKELRLWDFDCTPSALSQRRKSISPTAFYDVWQRFNELCADINTVRFHGKYRLWAIDGTEIPIFRNPDSDSHITTPSNPTGYNALHANIIHDITNSQFVDCAMGRDEQGKLLTLIYKRKFTEPTILVMDRGYESYNTVAHCCNIPNLFFVLRVRQGKGGFRDIQKLPMESLEQPFKTTVVTSQHKIFKEQNFVYLNTGSRKGKQLSESTRIVRFDHRCPYTFRGVRCCRFRIGNSNHYETLLTNLPADEFPLSEMEKIYSLRWKIEQGFDGLKNKTGLKLLHGRSDDYALQELYARLTFYNFTSLICKSVAVKQSDKAKSTIKISFKDATDLCRDFFRNPNADGEKLLADIAKYTYYDQQGRKKERGTIKPKTFVAFTYRTSA